MYTTVRCTKFRTHRLDGQYEEGGLIVAEGAAEGE